MPYHDYVPSPTLPCHRPGLGDDPGRVVKDGQGRGYLEWRWTPGMGVEIVNIEVANEHRRTGVGRLLLRQLVDLVGPQGAVAIWATTRSNNGIAHDWYRAMGFNLSGALRGFYDPTRPRDEDAYIFTRNAKEPVP